MLILNNVKSKSKNLDYVKVKAALSLLFHYRKSKELYGIILSG